MIDFELTDEQKEIKALIKEFCEREVDLKEMQRLVDANSKAKTVQELRDNQPKELLKKLNDVGLRQFCVPTEYGGGGFGYCGSVTRAIAAEELGYYMGMGARELTLTWMDCCERSSDIVPREQKDWFFSQIMKNPTMTTAVTGSEPSGITDTMLPYEEPERGYPILVLAHRDGDEWVINGDKAFSSGGGTAELLRAMTRTSKTGTLDQALDTFWVPKDTPGMSYAVNRMLAGDIAGNVQVSYDNVRVPESHRIEPRGWRTLEHFLAAKVMTNIDQLGYACRVYEQVLNYAKERVAGGVPIIQHSAIAAGLGEVLLHLHAWRAFAYRICWENDQREKAGKPLIGSFECGVDYWGKKTGLLLCKVGLGVYGGMAGSVDLMLEGFVRMHYTFPHGSEPMSMVKYSMANNDHILSCMAPRRTEGEKVVSAVGK